MRPIAVFVENRPFFGALLVHVPLLHALRERSPGARIVLLAPFSESRMLVELGVADEAIEYRGFADVLKALQRVRPHEALVLRPASRGIDLAVRAAGVPVRVGFDSWLARGLYTHVAPHDTSIYRARKYLTLIQPRAEALAAPLESWFLAAAHRATLATAAWRRTLAILPGGGAGDFKRWGAERFFTLAERLAAEDAALRFAWVLGPQEAQWRARIAGSPLAARSEVLFERPVPDLAAAAFAATAAVGNDCGPAHVFQMCGCPFACVVSDHDGEGAIRAAEWLDAANRPLASLPAAGQPIGAVGVDAVRGRAREALAAGAARARG
jgi:ADP-heptose:LPS heptosyltransferase